MCLNKQGGHERISILSFAGSDGTRHSNTSMISMDGNRLNGTFSNSLSCSEWFFHGGEMYCIRNKHRGSLEHLFMLLYRSVVSRLGPCDGVTKEPDAAIKHGVWLIAN